jgi:uncharacterized protein
MKFNVAQLLKSPAGASREYDLDEDIVDIDPSLEVVKPLIGSVSLLRTSEGILVTGHAQTEVRVPCGRCLTPTVTAVEFDLEEQFRPSIDLITGATVPMEEGEDPVTRIDGHHILDLTEVVRQNLLLSIPISSLCHPQCRGLCPGCGANLNEEACTCQREEGDLRLSALRELL